MTTSCPSPSSAPAAAGCPPPAAAARPARRKKPFQWQFWLPLGGLLALALLFAAVLLFSPYDPNQVALGKRLLPASLQHPLGTDQFGRDVLTRLAHGAVLSVGVAALSLAVSFIIGAAIGILAAWRGGLLATVALTLNDTLVIIPNILVMLGFVAAFGTGTLTLAVGMTALGWVVFARLAYQLTTRTLAAGYVEAAIALGAGSRRILLHHVWPNIARPLLTYMALRLPSKLLAFSGLSFLGLGPRPPQAEWGAMLSEARGFADRAPLVLVAPAATIVIISILFAALGSNATDVEIQSK
ncbi:MAG: ABC transporter permease [Brachymonas sp.]|nr:ABC transporter permease [Brachymonas sp.]